MENSENFADNIHNREYNTPFTIANLNHSGMIFMGGRKTEKLNGKWNYAPDLYDTFLRNQWYDPENQKAGREKSPWDYAPEDGDYMDLPVSWNVISPEMKYFEGTVIFSRTFHFSFTKGKERAFLRIGAANYDCKIFLNGQFLGNHAGGSTPFFVEMTDQLVDDNLLIVTVNNERKDDQVPMRNTDWFNWGGLYRDIEILRTPSIFIKDFRLELKRLDDKRIGFSVTLSEGVKTEGELIIEELGIRLPLKFNNGICKGYFSSDPELWEPDNPRLYRCLVQTGFDQVEDRVGFRKIERKGKKLFLNGKALFLKGISVHEDDVEKGKHITEKDLLRRFRHVKELGANTMRLAHYPHDEKVAQMADREGVLLWEEIPVYWAIDFDNAKTQNDAQNQLQELIRRDFNRASVIIWSVGNENADTDSRLNFMKKLVDIARLEDSGRMISAACLVNHVQNKIDDRLAEYLDIIGINEYYGWYNPDFEVLKEVIRNSSPEKPVLISEFGAGAKAGHHGSKEELFTEEYMDEVYRKQIQVFKTMDYLCGITPWILYDFTCPRRQNHFQKGFNRKGLIAEDKEYKKMAFYRLKDFYENY